MRVKLWQYLLKKLLLLRYKFMPTLHKLNTSTKLIIGRKYTHALYKLLSSSRLIFMRSSLKQCNMR